MQIFIKSICLFFLGYYADILQKIFEYRLKRQIYHQKDFSSPAIVKLSNKCYELYVSFSNLEYQLLSEIRAKSLIRKNI